MVIPGRILRRGRIREVGQLSLVSGVVHCSKGGGPPPAALSLVTFCVCTMTLDVAGDAPLSNGVISPNCLAPIYKRCFAKSLCRISCLGGPASVCYFYFAYCSVGLLFCACFKWFIILFLFPSPLLFLYSFVARVDNLLRFLVDRLSKLNTRTLV